MSPLGFSIEKIYSFIIETFHHSNLRIQKKALNWLQMLTDIKIVIPLDLLFKAFINGLRDYEPSGKKSTEKKNIYNISQRWTSLISTITEHKKRLFSQQFVPIFINRSFSLKNLKSFFCQNYRCLLKT